MFTSKKPKHDPTEPYRKLSPWRVMLAVFLLAGIAALTYVGLPQWRAATAETNQKPWFAAYVDVTTTPRYAFEQPDNTSNKQVLLSFVVAADKNSCEPSWAASYSMDEASSTLDLDRRIARLRQQNGNVAISFGGLLNTELASACTDEAKLKQAYKAVIDRYSVDTIDLDLEGTNLTDTAGSQRRAKVLADLQKEYRAHNHNLAVWVTLPVAPQGLTVDGTNAISTLLSEKVDLAGVNVMTMAYGNSLDKGLSMYDGSKNALKETHRQLGILYDKANIHQSSASIWSKLGATPMIGQNDDKDQVFTTKDAEDFNAYARKNNVGRMSLWSVNRDVACGQNYVDTSIVSTSCSGVTQSKLYYSNTLGEGFSATISESAGARTKVDKVRPAVADDPATSPYQIWSKSGAYLQGTKIVWHGNVYEAKWWNQGELPDDPVLQSWQTPWKLVGPVLPGEQPIAQATVPAGVYPNWSGDRGYNEGDRVIFAGVPYQAKWWNKAQSPAAYSSNADASAWVPLTQEQVNEVLKQL